MEPRLSELKKRRMDALFADCQKQVLSQVIGTFGLSTAMFDDRSGGNVTTKHNFARDDDSYVADKDKKSHVRWKESYERERYEHEDWTRVSEALRARGYDDYRGANADPGTMDADHVVSLKEIAGRADVHLAFQTGDDVKTVRTNKDGTAKLHEDGSEKKELKHKRVIDLAHDPSNLAATDAAVNRSKGSADLNDFSEQKGERHNLNRDKAKEIHERATGHIDKTTRKELISKQKEELIETGKKQALAMGIRQGLGLLLTELVNALFNEFKQLIVTGAEAGKTILQELKLRLQRVAASVMHKIPDALSQAFQGGVSGFVSNLFTFLVNNFLSTAKRFVTVIREGLVGLFRAFKMIFFPPNHMDKTQALQAGLKILTVVVVSSIAIIVQEAIGAFISSVPVLGSIANLVTPVLMGILAGLLTAFLAYQIDSLFDRLANRHDEHVIRAMLDDANARDKIVGELIELTESGLANIDRYARSIEIYDTTGAHLFEAATSGAKTTAIGHSMIAETSDLLEANRQVMAIIDATQPDIENFLKER